MGLRPPASRPKYIKRRGFERGRCPSKTNLFSPLGRGLFCLGDIFILDHFNLKKAGLKNTLPRRRILEILDNAKEHHLRAEDIYRNLLDMGEEIALATVYRVLGQFEAVGLVVRHYFEGGHSVYELNHGSHHDHLVCVSCGQVIEFVDDFIKTRQQEIARQAGFSITEHSLNIYGMCSACQKAR